MTREKERPAALTQQFSELAPVGEEAQETLKAIVLGEADALVLETENGPRVYTLREANEPYRRLIEQMSEAALILDETGRVLYCNGRLPRMLRRPAITGRPFFELAPPDQKGAITSLLMGGVAQEASAELTLLAHDEATLAVRAAAAPMTFNEHSCIALVVSALDDIEALKKSEAKLRTSEERLRRVLETDAVGVIFFDASGVLIDANDVFLRTCGYTRQDVDSRALHWRTLTPPEWTAVSEEQLHRLTETGRIGPYEKEYFLKDGSRRWHMFAGRDLGDGTVVEFCVDIDDRKRTEAALQASDKRKDEFLATLAHELRNPLAPLLNALEVLERTGKTDTDPLHAMMRRQVTYLMHLVDDLLDASRISQGKIELRRDFVDVADVISHAIETSEPHVKEGAQCLTVISSPEPLLVYGDQTRLCQVLTNLINNAAKYSAAGGRIEIESRRDGADAVILVRDEGLGISREMLPKVFDLFTQVRPRNQSARAGLGIGLALAKMLVELHGGSIEARSEGEGCGSEFIIRLPLGKSFEPMRLEEDTAPLAASARGMRVLVVDDDKDVADSTALLLRCIGADATVAYDGASAIQTLKDGGYALVLLDLGMPDMDGHQVARQIRALACGKDLVLVALSGWGRDEDQARSAAAGFDHHYVKPIDIACIEGLLAQVSAGPRTE